MNIALETKNLTKTYHKNRVIDDLNLKLPEGSVTGLLGPNGAGKSTLMKIMMDLVKPDSGTVKIFDQSPSWQLNAVISYLPDRSRWYGFHTVNQALEYGRDVFPNFDAVKARELVEFMSLDPEAKVKSLSRGQEARLLLLLCLSRDARLYLLDEPFTGIDLVSREKIISGIIDLAAGGDKTIVISTHEIHETESLFNHALFLDQGQLILSGDVEDLREREGSLESIYRRLFS